MIDDNRGDDVSLDEVLRLIATERRRLVLQYLCRRDDEVAVDELVDFVVARTGPTVDARPDELRSRVGGSLQHIHLPMMDDAGIVEYYRDRQTVATTDAIRAVEPYLEISKGDDSE